jgi:hypothetical protein
MAVGGTNGWFPDGSGDKPWLDNSATAARDFFNAKDTWLPTWPENNDDRSFVMYVISSFLPSLSLVNLPLHSQ